MREKLEKEPAKYTSTPHRFHNTHQKTITHKCDLLIIAVTLINSS